MKSICFNYQDYLNLVELVKVIDGYLINMDMDSRTVLSNIMSAMRRFKAVDRLR